MSTETPSVVMASAEDMASAALAEHRAMFDGQSIFPKGPALVKIECQRRILAVMPEHHQRNTLSARLFAQEQYGLDRTTWPAEVLAQCRLDDWAEIDRLRARSDEIEAMEPLPEDFIEDIYWS